MAGPVPEGAGLGDWAMEEHVLHDHLLLPLNLVGGGALLLQELVQFRGQVEHPPLSILRGPWIEPNLADAKVDLPPLDRQAPRC